MPQRRGAVGSGYRGSDILGAHLINL